MPRRHYQDRSRLRVVSAVALVLGVLSLPDSANAETNLAVEATAGYTDNLLRLPEGNDEVPVSLGLTGTWTENTRRLSADVDGRVDGITYLNDTFPSEVVGQLDALVTWWPAPERLAWVVQNVYGQVATDPFQAISPENRQNTNVLSTGPDWYIPLGARTRAYIGGRFGTVTYETTTAADSERLLGIAGVDRAVSSASRLGVQATTETVGFDSTLQPDFDRQQAYVRYKFGRQQQSDGRQLTEQQLEDRQSELTVNVGYTWLTSDVSDRSEPLVEVEYFRSLSPSVNLRLEFARRFADAGVEFAAGGLPGSSAGTDPGVIPLAGVYYENSGRFVIDFRRPRTILSCAVGVSDQQYETVALDRRRYDAQVTAERRMTRHLTGIAGVYWSRDDYELDSLDRRDTDTDYRLELRRELGRRSSLAIVGLYASRSSDDPRAEFDETRLYAVFTYSLR